MECLEIDLEMDEICRCCLLVRSADTDLLSMRVENFTYKDEKIKFYDSFIRCCGSIYKYLDGIDNRDPKICKFCRIQLESAYIFLDLITEANSILTDKIQQGKISTPNAVMRPLVEAPEVIIKKDKEVAAVPHGNNGKLLGLKYNKCKLCKKKYKSKKRHDMVYHPVKTNIYKCEMDCSNVYNTSKSLNQHLQRAHACPITGCYALKSEANLKTHLKSVHKMTLGTKEKTPSKPNKVSAENVDTPTASINNDCVEASFQCEHCDFKSYSNKGWKIHMFVKHSTKIGDSPTDPITSYNCKLCPLGFKTMKGLKLHINHRHRERQKSVPVALTKVVANISVNSFSVIDASTFKCSSCPAMFDTQRGVKVHILKTHIAQKAVDLNLKKRIHTSFVPKKHRCKDCGKNYNSYSQLYYHSYVHRGFPFQCVVCKRVYAQKDKFVTHLNTVHSLDVDSSSADVLTYNAKKS